MLHQAIDKMEGHVRYNNLLPPPIGYEGNPLRVACNSQPFDYHQPPSNPSPVLCNPSPATLQPQFKRFLVLPQIKTVKIRRLMSHPGPLFIQAAQYAIRKNLPLKIPPVQLLVQHRLIQFLQLRQSELPGQKLISYRPIISMST